MKYYLEKVGKDSGGIFESRNHVLISLVYFCKHGIEFFSTAEKTNFAYTIDLLLVRDYKDFLYLLN